MAAKKEFRDKIFVKVYISPVTYIFLFDIHGWANDCLENIVKMGDDQEKLWTEGPDFLLLAVAKCRVEPKGKIQSPEKLHEEESIVFW